MPRSDEAQAFFHAVYSAVQQVPCGKVTTYGHIATLIGTPQRPRQVGICLKHLPDDPSSRFNSSNVPWQRIINSKGAISPRRVNPSIKSETAVDAASRSQPSAAQNQAAALRAEGVQVTAGAMGELMVDFGEYGWFPDELPSEAHEEEDGHHDQV